MKVIGTPIVLALMMQAPSSESVPSALEGEWHVGTPYNTPTPIGISAEQEAFIKKLQFSYTTESLLVCGKSVPIRSVKQKHLTHDEFLQAYGFLPQVIGIDSSQIVDITINPSEGMNACGDYGDPGVHVFVSGDGHTVMEVANDYFPLIKATPGSMYK